MMTISERFFSLIEKPFETGNNDKIGIIMKNREAQKRRPGIPAGFKKFLLVLIMTAISCHRSPDHPAPVGEVYPPS